jgi:hypothetical protein
LDEALVKKISILLKRSLFSSLREKTYENKDAVVLDSSTTQAHADPLRLEKALLGADLMAINQIAGVLSTLLTQTESRKT